MKKSKELQTRSFISHNSTASLLPVVHFNPTLLVLSLSAHPVPGCVGWDLDEGPSHLQGSVRSKCCLTSHWPSPPLSICPRPPLCAWNPPMAFYPFIHPWDQNSRSGLGSVSGSVVSDIYWSISIHPSFSSLALLVHQKDVLSCVALLLSPGDEWHIRDSLQLIRSFMLSESKLQACTPFFSHFICCRLKSYLMSCSTSDGSSVPF